MVMLLVVVLGGIGVAVWLLAWLGIIESIDSLMSSDRRNQIAPAALPSRHPTSTKGRIMKAMLETLFDKFRMAIWLALGIALYVASFLIGSYHPTFQTVAYKLGHVTTLAWVGYWISRHSVGRIDDTSTPHDRIARGLVIVGVIIAGSLGL